MKQNLRPRFKTALASATMTTTTTSSAFSLGGLADTYAVVFNVTAASGTSPTLDIILQTSVDGGTTYVNLPLRTTQITAAGRNWLVFKLGLGDNEAAVESPAAATGGSLAKNCIFDPFFMKAVFTIGGTNPSFTVVAYSAVINSGASD